MEDLKIDIREWNNRIKDKYSNKDLISLEDLLRDYEDALYEIDELRSELRLKEQVEDDGYDYTDYMNDKICEIEYK